MTDHGPAAAADPPAPEAAAEAPRPASKAALPRGALGAWWREGFRSLVLMRVDWTGLSATPAVVLVLLLASILVDVLLERLHLDGPARFYWQALLSTHWFATAMLVFACWFLLRDRQAPPGPAALFAMLCAQGLPASLIASLLMLPMSRSGMYNEEGLAGWIAFAAWYLIVGWTVLAAGLMVWRTGARTPHRWVALLCLVAAAGSDHWLNRVGHWYPARDESASAKAEELSRFKLTQELVEQQSALLRTQLQALAPQRPGTIDVYALTFAPDADEAVFRRESAMVADVMARRFDAGLRSVQLVSQRDSPAVLPWATPLNLQRAIAAAAARMNRDEDVLFLHLTSHGGRDGRLASEFYPLDVDWLTPQMLKGWLDDAGVKHRVISVSACFSGSWIAPLSDPDTLVMTAADADHTSYGCGRRSPLTFFGRAMYDDEMRKTWSFPQAHAAARLLIEQREKEAGKTDGYSNPQIAMGERIRVTLERLAQQQAASAARP